MSKTSRAAVAPFAHLIANITGRNAVARAAEERDEDMSDDDAGEDDADAEEEDTDEPETGKRGRRGKRARKAEDGDDEDASAEDDDGAGADDGDNDDADDAEASAEARGAAAERARGRAIFSSKAAAGRPDLAAYFAFDTTMSAKEAIGAMAVSANAPTPRGRSLSDRMASRNDARPGADAGGDGKGPSLAAKIIAAGRKARGQD